jgi:Velvet factor
LIVTDAETGKEVSPWQLNSSLFFLAADLCHPEDLMLAPRNLLVHQHATSVPTSSMQGSSSSYAGDQRRSSNPGTIPMTSIRAPGSTYDSQQSFANQSGQENPSGSTTTSPSLPATTRNPPPPPSKTAAHSSGMDPAIQYPFHAAAAAAAAQRSSLNSGEGSSTGSSINQLSGQQSLTTVTMEHYTRNLVGAAVTSANVLRDEDDQFCIFFVLQDLSVRTEGVYRIRLIFTDLAQQDGDTVEGVSDALAEAYTDTFTVYSPRRFPGMLEPTELSKKLASQGVKIAVRSDKKKRQRGAEQAGSGLSWPSDIRGLAGPGTSGSGGGGSVEGGDGEGDEGDDEDD